MRGCVAFCDGGMFFIEESRYASLVLFKDGLDLVSL